MEWISVKDRLPEGNTKSLLLYDQRKQKYTGEFIDGAFEDNASNCKFNFITHWMTIENPVKRLTHCPNCKIKYSYDKDCEHCGVNNEKSDLTIGDILASKM